MEAPVSPAELVEILQGITEEQGLAFKTATQDRDMMKANRQLREEQDAAYFAALHLDKVIKDLCVCWNLWNICWWEFLIFQKVS